MDEIDCVVIGAGVVGLAVARALAIDGRDVVIVEKGPLIGLGASSRNSEVIHAGIYYPQGSLKARLCVEGRRLLYAYVGERNVAHRRCGKLIVAASAAQTPELDGIRKAAEANGVDDLQWLSGPAARALEPELRCDAALLSPSTGIIDSHGYMLALLGDAEAAHATLALRTAVAALEPVAGGVVLRFADDDAPALMARLVVNCAGIDAPGLARTCLQDRAPTAYYAKGNYFTLSGRTPFRHLVYPTPEPGGLGVHLTLDLAGQARFGPDVEWIDAPDYAVDPRRGDRFYAAIRQYWPGLPDGALAPAYAGIRAKISGPGDPAQDFQISGPADHGMAGLINLCGIESPGLTSSLAIGQVVCRMARQD